MQAIIMLVAVLLVFPVTGKAQTTVSRGQRLSETGAIRIYSLVGSVRITGWNRDSVDVRGTVGKGSSIHMGGGLSGIKLFVEDENDRNPAASKLEIMVPSKAKVWVKTATADILVSGVDGSLDLYVVSGNISVKGNPADINAEAIDGSIMINGSPGWLRAKSASGGVSLTGSTSDLTISTISGSINVRGSKFEKAKCETVTGQIHFAGGFGRGGLASFDTHSGLVDIRLAKGTGADFDIVSIAGRVINKLTSASAVPGRYGRGAELNTSSGEGGTRVVVRSFKGDVTLGSQ